MLIDRPLMIFGLPNPTLSQPFQKCGRRLGPWSILLSVYDSVSRPVCLYRTSKIEWALQKNDSQCRPKLLFCLQEDIRIGLSKILNHFFNLINSGEKSKNALYKLSKSGGESARLVADPSSTVVWCHSVSNLQRTWKYVFSRLRSRASSKVTC